MKNYFIFWFFSAIKDILIPTQPIELPNSLTVCKYPYQEVAVTQEIWRLGMYSRNAETKNNRGRSQGTLKVNLLADMDRG